MNKGMKLPENLIIDYYELRSINVLHDAAKNEDITEFEGYAQEADKKNLNERIYPAAVLVKALDKVQSNIKKNKVVAYVNHPSWLIGEDLEKIGAIITEAHLIDGVVRIKGRFTSTDAARNLKALLKDGYCVGISARGRGTATYDEKLKAHVLNDDYVVEGWDFVSTPAVQKAAVTAYENYIKQNNNEEDTPMEKFNSLQELKIAYPNFIADALKPVEDAVVKVTAEKDKAVADAVVLSNELKSMKETNAKLEKELTDAKAEVTKAKEAEEKAKFDAAVVDMLKDNKYKAYISVPASIKSVADAKAFIDAETAKYDKLIADHKGTTAGSTDEPKVPGKTEDKQKTTPSDSIMDEYIKLATRQ